MRVAAPGDMPRLIEMGRAFHDYYEPSHPWDAEAFAGLMMQLPFLTVSDEGFLAGMILPSPLNPNWIVAQELMWWSKDGTGPRHMRAFRKWAKASKANEILWSCHDKNERVQRFYHRFSRPLDSIFSEVL